MAIANYNIVFQSRIKAQRNYFKFKASDADSDAVALAVAAALQERVVEHCFVHLSKDLLSTDKLAIPSTGYKERKVVNVTLFNTTDETKRKKITIPYLKSTESADSIGSALAELWKDGSPTSGVGILHTDGTTALNSSYDGSRVVDDFEADETSTASTGTVGVIG